MKHEKPVKKHMPKTEKILLVILGVVLALNIAVVAAVLSLPKPEEAGQGTQPTENQIQQQNTEPEQTTQSTDPVEPTNPVQPAPKVLDMPYVLIEGKLTVESLFELDGLNPDCDNAEASGVVGIQLTNTSQEHLHSLELYLTAPDGTVMEFFAADIPSGMTVMMFSLDNLSMEGEPACTKIECNASFDAEPPLMTEQVEISVVGTEITVKNISGEELSQITVYCHSVLAESYYGGITYQYVIDSLPAGGSATVTALDCYLGLTEVVRIDIGD